jgi:dihydropyrimidinase
VLAGAPARLFGLESKGALAAGLDADLVVWGPETRRILRQADLHHTSDYTPYEGMELSGAPVRVLSRGADPEVGAGRYVGRHRS